METTIQKNLILILTFFCMIAFWGCDSNEKSVSSKGKSPKSQGQTQHTRERKPADSSLSSSPDDWTMLMYDLKHSGKSPDKSLKPPLELKWKFKTGGQIKASPVVAYDTVYAGSDDNRLYALDAKEWGQLWSFEADGKISNSPTIWNGTVYFNTADDKIYALDAKTGKLKWDFKVKSWMESPVVVTNGKVYAGAFKQHIYVLDAYTGKQIGKKNLRIKIDDTLYICNLGKFRPRNPATKTDFWQKKTLDSTSLPVSANGVVYIGAYDKKIHAFNQKTKEEMWRYETDGWIDSAAAISHGMLYVTSRDGYVYAFENADDKKKPESDTKFGTVAHDRAVVYSLPDETSNKLTVVNDGMNLPLINKKSDWYKIQLPNGKTGWMNKYDFAIFDDYNGIKFNSAFINSVENLVLPEGAESPHWSPDEQTVAFFVRTDLKGQYWKATQLWVSEENTKSSKKITDGVFYNPNLSWSLDSKWIAFESYYMDEPYVWIIQRDGSDAKRLVKGNAPAFSPKSHQIAFRHWEGRTDLLFRVNIDGSGQKMLAKIPIEGRVNQFRHLDQPVWSPDGKRIALGIDSRHYKHGYARILIVDKNGENFQSIFTHSDYARNIQWHPDGQKLVYVLSGHHGDEIDKTLDKRIVFADLNDTEVPVATFKHTLPSLSPDGSQIIFAEREDCMGLKWKLWIVNLTGEKTGRPLARTNLNISSVDWLRKGICIWSTSSYIREGKYKPAKTIGWLVQLSIDD